jgi:hypothetical protein
MERSEIRDKPRRRSWISLADNLRYLPISCHSEVLGAKRRASKGNSRGAGAASFEARFARTQDDGSIIAGMRHCEERRDEAIQIFTSANGSGPKWPAR